MSMLPPQCIMAGSVFDIDAIMLLAFAMPGQT
jgi:hypothetical protein